MLPPGGTFGTTSRVGTIYFAMEDVVCVRCSTINEYHTEVSGPHVKAICDNCGRYIKFLSQEKPKRFYFGKYKGDLIAECSDKNYLKWLLQKQEDPDKTFVLSAAYIEEIELRIDKL